uniref:Tektin n=1 Tax=Panagrolaimus sp. PS1159 TaxID=55785 RepID=A0AC35FDX7_9BILA
MHRRVEEYEDPSEVLRMARLAVKEANNRAMRMQNQTTQQLVQRVKDLKYWSGEIDRELQDLREDNDDLQRYFRKLRTCAAITQDAMKCNEACNAVRRKRIHVDANDRVDGALGKEKDTIGDCVKQMREFSSIIDRQIEINEESKNKLMRDFTLKQEAVSLDHRAAAVAVDSKYLLKRPPDSDNLELRDVGPLQRMSEYQEWVENTASNLNSSAKARTRSRKIVQRLIGTTRDLAQAMRQEAINVENTLKDSIRVWNEWRDSLQAQLNAKEKDMKVADAAIAEIDGSLRLKGSPLQVALARQSQRCLRPGIELCNDKAQHALQAELNNLKSTTLSLEHQLAKESRRKLDGERYKIQRKLEICQQNVAVDYEILRQIRATYPQEIQLSGFLVGELPKAIVK